MKKVILITDKTGALIRYKSAGAIVVTKNEITFLDLSLDSNVFTAPSVTIELSDILTFVVI